MKTVYKKRVSFHETDCMAVVHHSTYLKYLEDARVNHLYDLKMNGLHAPDFDYTLAVTGVELKYIKPLRLGEEFEVKLKVARLKKLGFVFYYEVHSEKGLHLTGKSEHVGLNSDLKVVKPPQGFEIIDE